MKNANSAAAELAFLFKVMPAMQDVNTVDQIYRLLLAIATAGETIGNRGAFRHLCRRRGQPSRDSEIEWGRQYNSSFRRS